MENFSQYCEVRHKLGLQDRAIAVLEALLSFYPSSDLVAENGLVVFPPIHNCNCGPMALRRPPCAGIWPRLSRLDWFTAATAPMGSVTFSVGGEGRSSKLMDLIWRLCWRELRAFGPCAAGGGRAASFAAGKRGADPLPPGHPQADRRCGGRGCRGRLEGTGATLSSSGGRNAAHALAREVHSLLDRMEQLRSDVLTTLNYSRRNRKKGRQCRPFWDPHTEFKTRKPF